MKKLYFLVVVILGFGSVSGQIVNIPNVNFKAELLSASPSNGIASTVAPSYNPLTGIWTLPNVFVKIDTNNDGHIQVSEAQAIKFLDIDGYTTDLMGIQAFINLEYLDCKDGDLTTLNLQNLSNLRFLDCFGNDLTSLNISGLGNLISLQCNSNELSNLDVTGLTNLIYLNCGANNLTNIDISGLVSLQRYSCQSNNVTSLIFPPLPNLKIVNCWDNQMTYLDVSALTNLEALYCGLNQLAVLDITNNSSLAGLSCGGNNQLSTLLLKNNNPNNWTSSNISFSGNPNLTYICVDEQDITTMQNLINTAGYAATCSVSSYCSFNSGGNYYTLQGSNTFDSNNNGCDAADVTLPNLKFNATTGTQSGSFISNQSGQYSIPVQAGTHTITPVIENPTYFNFSPTTCTVTFPATTSPFTQNFCFTPNGVHPDLETVIVPTTPARPGFDADYKLIIKNKGNIQQSGSVTFTYNDAVLDYVSANPIFTSQTTGLLTWDFAALQPFETREISLTLNVNSPMETPAVNGGDVLNYSATISSPATDDSPLDNTFSLPQTVVNSFDPNDKTCLEGTSITPDMIGKYVHYMIRFENTGTFAAENIVVKDMIDQSKFDISSLIPLNASHNYTTRITGNKVEFIFENINLPFDDANNDGYIVFKIKTLPTLALGDSFSNSASIYFDYNFPIVTDPAITTFAVLGTDDFEFSKYLTVYPNPVNDLLKITSKQNIELRSMEIYNMIGQLVISVPNANGISSIDVTNLSTGNYFLKIVSNKGTSNVKFIKK